MKLFMWILLAGNLAFVSMPLFGIHLWSWWISVVGSLCLSASLVMIRMEHKIYTTQEAYPFHYFINIDERKWNKF